MTISPLSKRIAVTLQQPKQNQVSEIVIAKSIEKENIECGKIVGVAKDVQFRIKAGDVIYFSKYGFDEAQIDGKRIVFVDQDNLLAIAK